MPVNTLPQPDAAARAASDALLARIASARPSDADQMRQILGERHADRFGAAFLGVLRRA